MKFIDRASAYPNRYLMIAEDGNTSRVILERADEPTVVGTPLNAETFNTLLKMVLMPIGFTFEWTPVDGGPDLSTAEKVAEYYGFGTWEAYGAGRFTLGVSDQYSAGSVGGKEKHTLTVDEMPRHNHQLTPLLRSDYASQYTTGQYTTILTADNLVAPNQTVNAHTSVFAGESTAAGGGQPHNNMPPYVAVYRWRRIA